MRLSVKTELCAASIEAIQIAKALKLDRIELCQSLEQGGLTPSAGLIEYALGTALGHNCGTICLGIGNRPKMEYTDGYKPHMLKLIHYVLGRI